MTDPTSDSRSQLTSTLEMYLGDLLAEHERLVEEDREKAANVADLVHDLRGSITSLSLRIYMLEHSDAEKQSYYLAELKDSVSDLTKMAEDLLNRMRNHPDD